MCSCFRKQNFIKGFTLLELLIVIAILAILATTVVLVLNPAEYLKQSRDSKRLTDIEALNKALSLAEMEGIDLGATSTVYVSIPDTSATCANLGLPDLPASWNYHCVTDNNLRKTDSNGWVPVNFSSLVTGSPLSVLPVDPINATSTGNYYTYVPGGSWVLTSLLESEKYLKNNATKDGGTDDARIEMGTDLNLWSQASGLVGYWKMEGDFRDSSGKNNHGTGYNGVAFASGKQGQAGSFDGVNDYVSAPSTSIFASYTLMQWTKGVLNEQRPGDNIYGLGWDGRVAFRHNYGGGTPLTGILIAQSDCSTLFAVETQINHLDNDWHLLVATVDGLNVKIYLDGSLRTSGIVPSVCAQSRPIIMSAWTSGYGFFKGLVDDIRIYNRALTPSEIKAIYDATK